MQYKGFKLADKGIMRKFDDSYTLYKSGTPSFDADGKGVILGTTGNIVIIPKADAKEIINPQQGTIRFNVDVKSVSGGIETFIRTDTNGGSENRIFVLQAGSILNFAFGTAFADEYSGLTVGSHLLVLTWDALKAELYLDDMITPILTLNNPPLPTSIGHLSIGSSNGEWPGTQNVFTGAISNLMISRVKRRRHLDDLIDKNTTFLAELTSDYSATVMRRLPQPIPENTITLAGNPDRYEAWPQICALANRKLLAFYTSNDHNWHMFDPTGKVAMRTSVDDGLTWSEEYRFPQVGTGLNNGSDGLCVFMHDGVETIINIFSTENSDATDMKDYVRRSTDGGETWSEPVLIRSNSLACGNPTELSNGNLIYGTIQHNPYIGHINVEISSDGGYNWTQHALGADETLLLTECAIQEVKTSGTYQGHLIAVVRNEKGTSYKVFKSADYGVTWDSGTDISGITKYTATKPALTRYGDWLILATGDGVSQWETVLYLSSDEGETWNRKHIVNVGVSARSYADAVVYGDYVGVVWCTNLLTPVEWSDVYFTRFKKTQLIPE